MMKFIKNWINISLKNRKKQIGKKSRWQRRLKVHFRLLQAAQEQEKPPQLRVYCSFYKNYLILNYTSNWLRRLAKPPLVWKSRLKMR